MIIGHAIYYVLSKEFYCLFDKSVSEKYLDYHDYEFVMQQYQENLKTDAGQIECYGYHHALDDDLPEHYYGAWQYWNIEQLNEYLNINTDSQLQLHLQIRNCEDEGEHEAHQLTDSSNNSKFDRWIILTILQGSRNKEVLDYFIHANLYDSFFGNALFLNPYIIELINKNGFLETFSSYQQKIDFLSIYQEMASRTYYAYSDKLDIGILFEAMVKNTEQYSVVQSNRELFDLVIRLHSAFFCCDRFIRQLSDNQFEQICQLSLSIHKDYLVNLFMNSLFEEWMTRLPEEYIDLLLKDKKSFYRFLDLGCSMRHFKYLSVKQKQFILDSIIDFDSINDPFFISP